MAAAACASRSDTAADLASISGLAPRTIAGRQFDLAAYVRPGRATTLTVYLEGDGFAWVTRSRPSSDPTPKDPMALRLAAADRTGAVAWLARPCQYVGGAQGRGCHQHYWTEGRYAEEVVADTDAALDRLKAETGAARLRLVGYSGGGTLAALVAARRTDVDLLVTVAGMLDTQAWVRAKELSPLSGSLDPAAQVDALGRIPQIHFSGADDRDVPPLVARSFAARFPAGHTPELVELAGFDHHCCWPEAWPRLRAQAERQGRVP